MRRLLGLVVLLVLTVPLAGQQQAVAKYIQTQTVTNAATVAVCTAASTPANCSTDTATTAAFVSVETNPIRWLANGTAPTTTTGHLANAGATITINGHLNVTQFRMIATGANASVTSTVFRP
jgi:hypothetical protein